MEPRAWTRPVSGGSTVQVTIESDDASDHVIRYRVAFPFVVGDSSTEDLLITGESSIEEHSLRSDSGVPVSDLLISIPGDRLIERLIVDRADERVVIHLPAGGLLTAIEQAIEGDECAVEQVLETFDSPVQIPLVCGGFLGIQETLKLIQELVRIDRHAESMIHSYRYAIVRSALVCRNGLYVASDAELEELVSGMNDIAAIGDVSKIEALGDVMDTVHDSVEETEALLESLGYDIGSVVDGENELLANCYLAHVVCTEGIDQAERCEPSRGLPSTRDYDRRKRAVLRSDYGERSGAWRRILDDARRQSPDEFRAVLARVLFWTAEESRSDSRTAELLYRGAEVVASDVGERRIQYWARYSRLIAAGHRLRGTHCYELSIANFEAARELATEQRFLGEWEPILAEGIVKAHLQSTRGRLEQAIEVLDRTLETFLDADPPKRVASRSVHHIKAQKCETEASVYQSDDVPRARELLAEAEDHYGLIGFERSRDRVQRKLAELEPVAKPKEPADTRAEMPEAPKAPVKGRQTVSEPPQTTVDPTDYDPDIESESSSRAKPDILERIDYPEEFEKEGSTDRFDDPYVI